MKRVWLLVLGTALLCATIGYAKSKRHKRAKTQQTPQAQVEEQKPMTLSARCMAYCEFTQNCLSDICTENPTVSVETCFNQCKAANDLTDEELHQTRQAGCLRTNAVYCSSGLLDNKRCNCEAPRAQCAPNQQCNIPLNGDRWACSDKPNTPSNHLPCDFFNPCQKGSVCVGQFPGASSGVCVLTCTPPKKPGDIRQKQPVNTEGVAQASDK
ncbi:MAG: hypothetical protein CMH56_14150 [Myxococcales bacterium]|nr:hypothetical protein [Myxococcales bacterium]|tara:strand:+ start:333 stop:968 length:636 start_codon:yes stop_codon:yes gene_type:complete